MSCVIHRSTNHVTLLVILGAHTLDCSQENHVTQRGNDMTIYLTVRLSYSKGIAEIQLILNCSRCAVFVSLSPVTSLFVSLMLPYGFLFDCVIVNLVSSVPCCKCSILWYILLYCLCWWIIPFYSAFKKWCEMFTFSKVTFML